MNFVKLFALLVLSLVSLVNTLCGQYSAVMRRANYILLPNIATREMSSDAVELPAFIVNAKMEAKVSYRVEKAVENLFEVKRVDSTVEIVQDMVPMAHSIESSPFAGFSLPVSEFKKLRNGIEVPGIGWVYSSAGARWRVYKDNPYLTRAIVSFHGGPMIKQSYKFNNWNDLKNTLFIRPIEKILGFSF